MASQSWYNYPLTEGYNPPVEWGNDIGVPMHTPITNLYGGSVVDASCGHGWGCEVGIQTQVPGYGSLVEYFQHLDTLNVQVGQSVGVGDLLGLSGGQTSGGFNPNSPTYSSGPHIEFGFGAPWVGAPGCQPGTACNPNSIFAIKAAQAGKLGQGTGSGSGPTGPTSGPTGPGGGTLDACSSCGAKGSPGYSQCIIALHTTGKLPSCASQTPPSGLPNPATGLGGLLGITPSTGTAGTCNILDPSTWLVCLANTFGCSSVEDMLIRAGLIIIGAILIIVGFGQLFKGGTSVTLRMQPAPAQAAPRSSTSSKGKEGESSEEAPDVEEAVEGAAA